MIEVKDRAVQYPNRYQLATVAGQSNTYDLVAVPGTVAAEGTPVNKALLDQYLAASGTTGGSDTALTLAQAGFSLADGAYIRAKLHTTIKNSVTLNINNTGAKSLVCADGRAPYLPAGTSITAIYNSSTDKYVCLSDSIVVISGSYTGDGAASRTVSLPFTPSAVLIRRNEQGSSSSHYVHDNSHLALTGSPASSDLAKGAVLTVTTNGFIVYTYDNNARSTNWVDHIWHYVAFK